MKNLKFIAITSAIIIPTMSFATPLGGVRGLLVGVGTLLAPIQALIFGLAMLYFFWGVSQFILKDAGNEKTRSEGKNKMIWGIVALFIMFSINAILNMIGNTLDIQVGDNSAPKATVTTSETFKLN